MDPYVERGCARTPTLLGWGVGLPALAAAAVVATALTAPALVWVPVVLLVLVLVFTTTPVVRAWPAGIRVDADGITLGRLTGRARGRVAPSMQAWARLSADWSAIRSAEVVTGDELAAIRGSTRRAAATADIRPAGGLNPVDPLGGRGFAVGRLLPAGTRAVLVVRIHAGATTTVPQLRTPRGQGVADAGSWAFPTRRPEQLKRALAAFDPSRPGGTT